MTTIQRNSTDRLAVQQLQRWLTWAGYPCSIDGNFGPRTEAQLTAFQRSTGLLNADGVFGPMSFVELRKAVWKAQGHTRGLEHVPVDAWRNSFDFFRLRKDVAQDFKAVLAEVKAAGALITSAGADRALNAPVTEGRSPTSMHYPAVAFDLSLASGMGNPAQDAYVIEYAPKSAPYTFQVWARCFNLRSPKLPPLRTIENPITYHQRQGTGTAVTGHFFDLTAAMLRGGFEPIRAWQGWHTGGNWIFAEWWHFQTTWRLFPGFSTMRSELLDLYTQEQIAASPLARSGGIVYKRNWF
jgi:hypothetical protein